MERISLTMKELERIRILDKLKSKTIKQIDAAKLMNRSERQVRRILKRYLELGEQGVPSKLRGRASNHRLSEVCRKRIARLIAQNYPDFGPTLATEKLREVHGIKVSVETVRGLMIEGRLWVPNVKKPHRVHPRRERRASIGEMAQADASFHDWFEGRGPKCALHVAVDDATSALKEMYFKETESLAGYFELFRGYFQSHGRPLNVYVDRHSIFRVNKKDPLSDGKEHLTQFGRALKDLDINLIHAHSPQAKGRVERVNRTLQDRLVKEMRLAGISNIADANAFLPQFIKEHNARFAKPAANQTNLHRPLESYHNLEKILTPHDYRIIQKDLTLSYEGSLYQIMHKEEKHRLAKKSVLLWRDAQGKLRVELEGRELEICPLSEVIGDSNREPPQWKDKKPFKPGRDHPYKNLKSKAA